MDKKNLGEIIKTARKKKGLSQYDLADLIGIAQANIALWEVGKRGMTVENFIKLAEILDIVPEVFPKYFNKHPSPETEMEIKLKKLESEMERVKNTLIVHESQITIIKDNTSAYNKNPTRP